MQILHEEPKEETPTKVPSIDDHTKHLYEELQPGHKVPTVLDPFWESFCQKKNDMESGSRQMVEYLKAVALGEQNLQFGGCNDPHSTKGIAKPENPGGTTYYLEINTDVNHQTQVCIIITTHTSLQVYGVSF